jgi:hypothetical protein
MRAPTSGAVQDYRRRGLESSSKSASTQKFDPSQAEALSHPVDAISKHCMKDALGSRRGDREMTLSVSIRASEKS